MTLSELKSFMVERKRASLTEISIHFDTAASAVRPMVEQWIAKGRLRKLDIQGGCGKAGSGCACKEPPSEVFEWTA
ncbi:FeoC-like transcriptional regulator [Magnetospirillum sulfuroxidans]|uniref:FeoC-like transcriptional regulator n=1 Tax=Magnetospirillum sulfuroxidans TaxID=611300 RepID=A0ABS5IHZ1_9PROT|nr:FeoC-like transcriptional regulator [Magnetospirillum sulfuroxidans]MBR9973323.1 FeoC-like transcriptional regulator [Magnetospirillum sulfuroxidans]